MLDKAKQLLKQTYQSCLQEIQHIPHFKINADEKYTHSLQVLGAGNYLLKHEKFFTGKSPKFIELVKTALVLHDIARFEEIIVKYKTLQDYDHGVEGAKLLQNIPLYNDILITLPIKHHGHMIEDFYDDESFKSINNDELKENLKNIIFLIRDADKIANFQLLCSNRFQEWHQLFYPQADNPTRTNKIIKEMFMQGKISPRGNDCSQTDKLINLLSWFYDINYQSSFDFCHKLQIDKKLINLFIKVSNNSLDNDIIQKITLFLQEKQHS